MKPEESTRKLATKRGITSYEKWKKTSANAKSLAFL